MERIDVCLSPLSTKPRIETFSGDIDNSGIQSLSPLSTKPRIETFIKFSHNEYLWILSKSFIH